MFLKVSDSAQMIFAFNFEPGNGEDL